MRDSKNLNVVARLISGAVVGFAVTLIFAWTCLATMRLSWRDVPALASLICVGIVLTALIFLLLSLFLLGKLHEPSLRSAILLGAVSAVGPVVVITYMVEGFEYGVVALLADPISWVWFVGFCLGGASLGWVWHARRETGAL